MFSLLTLNTQFFASPANLCLFQVRYRNTRKICEICSKLTILNIFLSFFSVCIFYFEHAFVCRSTISFEFKSGKPFIVFPKSCEISFKISYIHNRCQEQPPGVFYKKDVFKILAKLVKLQSLALFWCLYGENCRFATLLKKDSDTCAFL